MELDLTTHELEDVLQLRLSLRLMANASDPGLAWIEGIEIFLPVGEGSEGTSEFLSDLADAVDAGRIFGFLMEREARAQLRSGEWKPLGKPYVVGGKLQGIMPDGTHPDDPTTAAKKKPRVKP